MAKMMAKMAITEEMMAARIQCRNANDVSEGVEMTLRSAKRNAG